MQSDHRTEVKSPEENENSSNKRIAKNAVMLYLRMFLTMIVGFYTSRVVLDTLGVEDYGIYGIVGGVVAMFSILNASMSGATSRFLTFELGRGNPKRLAKTFSSALIVHVGIAMVVFVLAETVGLWFLANKLVIPPERMGAAHWVYQLSIVSTMLGITQVPYNATIIAHEKMDVYAYVEILSVTLKLLIVYLLTIGNFDKLILYATLVFAVGVLILIIYRLYCIRHFPESHFHWVWDKSILTPLISFSGWNLYGHLGGMAQQQGTNFVINFFYGVVMNAAVSIGLTMANVVNQFASNVTTAFRPQIIKLYSQNKKEEMRSLTILAIKIIIFIYSLVAIPVYVEAENLLKIWLVEVPTNAVVFCRIFLISIFFETIRHIIIINIHATGNVKLVSAFAGSVFILIPVITYLLYRLHFNVEVAFVLVVCANMLLCMVNMFLVKHYVRIGIFPYFKAIGIISASSAAVLLIMCHIKQLFPDTFFHIITNSIISVLLVFFFYFLFCFSSDQRQYAVHFIKSKFHLN